MRRRTRGGSDGGGGAGFVSLLTVLFIGLKLGRVIDWGWVWVLSPLWISTAAVVLVCLGVIGWHHVGEVRERRAIAAKRKARSAP